MARIAYSMLGEGRGHATRVRAMVEMLRTSHSIVLYAPGDAHELLAAAYAGTAVEVRPRELHARCLQLSPSGNAVALAAMLHHLPPRSAPAHRRLVVPAPAPLRPATLRGHP